MNMPFVFHKVLVVTFILGYTHQGGKEGWGNRVQIYSSGIFSFHICFWDLSTLKYVNLVNLELL